MLTATTNVLQGQPDATVDVLLGVPCDACAAVSAFSSSSPAADAPPSPESPMGYRPLTVYVPDDLPEVADAPLAQALSALVDTFGSLSRLTGYGAQALGLLWHGGDEDPSTVTTDPGPDGAGSTDGNASTGGETPA